MSVTRRDIVEAARAWLGTPWRHQGRNEHGLDCIGLLVVVYRSLGLMSYDSTAYSRDPDAAKFLQHFTLAGGIRINAADALDGDALVFRQTKFPVHGGICSTMHARRSVIHAHIMRRRVVEEIVLPEAPLLAAYRLPGVVEA